MRMFARFALLLAALVLPAPVALASAAGAGPAGPVGSLEQGLDQADALYGQRQELANVQQAAALLEGLNRQFPGNYQVLWRLARAYEWIGREGPEDQKVEIFDKARSFAEQAVTANPDGIEGHYWLGVNIGRWGESRGILRSLFAVKPMKEALEAVLARDPNHAKAHYVLSLLYRKAPGWPLSIGNDEVALEHAQRAVSLDPSNTSYHLALAEALIELGRKGEARGHLQAILDMPLTPGEVAESTADKEIAKRLLSEL